MRLLIEFRDLRPKKGITASKATLRRKEMAGKFPKRVYTSAQRYAYVEDEIDAYVEALIAARDNAAVRECEAESASRIIAPSPTAKRRGRPPKAALATVTASEVPNG